jgi:hypothetical protein
MKKNDTTRVGGRDPRPYERPQLKKYGTLAELTRTGTGTLMESGMGPSSRFE